MSETLPPTSTDSEPEDMTRRNFIEHVGFMSGTALLYAACKPSEPKKSETTVPPAAQTSHRAFSSEEYDTMSAVVERICPRDEEPGAIDLGVPEYIDRAMVSPTLSHVRDEFARGIGVLMRRAQEKHQKPFTAIAPEAQDALLKALNDAPKGTGDERFWTLLIALTMEGLFGDPVHGGNRGGRGWELIGFGQKRRGCADPSGHHHHGQACETETRKG